MKLKEFDTITAIATSLQDGGIGIIRISGENAFQIAEKIFISYSEKNKNKKISEFDSHTINYGAIKNSKGEIIDEVLLSIMKAPKTYTCEDIVEINCHGGVKVVKTILDEVVKNGARIADAGEFTKRAFLNGRIDLTQAEAVIDIINAKTELAHKSAINRLEGKLAKKIKTYREEILTMLAHIEASIDYPEHSDETMTYNTIKNSTLNILTQLNNLLKNADTGKIIKDGIQTVILGKANVGKSSILNFLLEEDRAIVSNIAGTTRDILQENININGVHLNIIDTAGIRETKDEIEKIGVQKSKQYAQNADLIFLVLDASKSLDEQDFEILEFIKNKKVIILINKIDLEIKLDIRQLYKYFDEKYIIKTSVREELGFEILQDKLQELFFDGEINFNEEVLISNERNKSSLYNSIKSLENVLETIQNCMPEDFISMDLIETYNYLGEITGESLEEDIIDKIFSEFCLGK